MVPQRQHRNNLPQRHEGTKEHEEIKRKKSITKAIN
jgi:hypothetical protein